MAFSRCPWFLMEKVTFSVTFLVLVFKCNGQITSSLQDEIKCTGESVTLNWAYNTANELVATWLFGTSTIMTGVSGGTPTVDNAYTGRATHGGNGVLTLTGLTTADSGTYSLSVTYGAAPGSDSDSVEVMVYDKISQESTPVCGTNTVTCGSSSLSGVTYSWTVNGAATTDTSWSITSRGGTKMYACTISGDRVTNCLDAGIATTKSASCTFEEETTTVHATSEGSTLTSEITSSSSESISSDESTTTSSQFTVTTDIVSTTRRDLDVDDLLLAAVVSSVVGGIILIVILAFVLYFLIRKMRASSLKRTQHAPEMEGFDNKGMTQEKYSNSHKKKRNDPYSNAQRIGNYRPKSLGTSYSTPYVNSGNPGRSRSEIGNDGYAQISDRIYPSLPNAAHYSKPYNVATIQSSNMRYNDGYLLYGSS